MAELIYTLQNTYWQVLLNKQLLITSLPAQSHPQESFSKEHRSKATLKWKREERSLCSAPEIHVLRISWLAAACPAGTVRKKLKGTRRRVCVEAATCWYTQGSWEGARQQAKDVPKWVIQFVKNMLDLDWESLNTSKTGVLANIASQHLPCQELQRLGCHCRRRVSKLCPNNKCSCLQAVQPYCDGLWEPRSRAQLQASVCRPCCSSLGPIPIPSGK